MKYKYLELFYGEGSKKNIRTNTYEVSNMNG